MDGYKVYQTYLSLKRHFSDDGYDYFKYNGKVRASRESFEKRNDRAFFERLAKRSDYRSFLLANILENDKLWIGETAEDKADKIFKQWKSRKESIGYIFKQDLENIDKSDFLVKDNMCPLVMKYRRKEIKLETLVLLNLFTNFHKYIDAKSKDTVVWPDVRRKIVKYQVFLEKMLSQNSQQKIKQILEVKFK